MYSDTDIWQALHNGDISISPLNEDQLGINSYDVCLGNDFYEVRCDKEGPYFVGPYHFEDGERVYIPVGGTLLGTTKEKVGTKGKVVAELRSRSSTRRIGVTTNCDAGLGDIGYSDYWTIELSAFISNSLVIELLIGLDAWLNRNGFGVAYLSKLVNRRKNDRPYLIVGQPVAQMVFYECKSTPSRLYSGQYRVDWPENMVPSQWRDRIVAPK